jgi:hypothetical protein
MKDALARQTFLKLAAADFCIRHQDFEGRL